MLGVIAIGTKSRTLDSYAEDLRDRGQTEERIAEVKKALAVLQ
jgi:hypothetical protein